ncbi:MAG: hypothetical protein WC852_02585 [Candidatus Nanoarchaeia archaeon]|jgi:hypothetical protein
MVKKRGLLLALGLLVLLLLSGCGGNYTITDKNTGKQYEVALKEVTGNDSVAQSPLSESPSPEVKPVPIEETPTLKEETPPQEQPVVAKLYPNSFDDLFPQRSQINEFYGERRHYSMGRYSKLSESDGLSKKRFSAGIVKTYGSINLVIYNFNEDVSPQEYFKYHEDTIMNKGGYERITGLPDNCFGTVYDIGYSANYLVYCLVDNQFYLSTWLYNMVPSDETKEDTKMFTLWTLDNMNKYSPEGIQDLFNKA